MLLAFVIELDYATDKNMREPMSYWPTIDFEHGKFCLDFIRQCKKLANLCHQIENLWFAWDGNRDHISAVAVVRDSFVGEYWGAIFADI
jgi:hypothetical protein